jgi:hypothetical protein
VPNGSEALEKYRMVGRESVFSTQRLLFTVLQNRQDPHTNYKKLHFEVDKIVREELNGRAYATSQGVRELSGIVDLQPNNFQIIDDAVSVLLVSSVVDHLIVFLFLSVFVFVVGDGAGRHADLLRLQADLSVHGGGLRVRPVAGVLSAALSAAVQMCVLEKVLVE